MTFTFFKSVWKLIRPKPLTAVLEEDHEGWVAHFKQFPDTYAQGDTQDEALTNLLKTLVAVINLEKEDLIEELDDDTSSEHSTADRVIYRELPFQTLSM